MLRMKIGELSRRTGTSAPTIRYYESIGLLPAPLRESGGQRSFDEADERRVRFIGSCRELGFSLEQISGMTQVMLDTRQSCEPLRDVAQAQLSLVRSRIKELQAMQKSLERLVQDCSARCAGGPAQDCVIGDALHGQVSTASACCTASSASCCAPRRVSATH